MKSGKIEIVSHEGELFFKCDGILLDLLDAHDFYYAEISVVRNGKEFDNGMVFRTGDVGVGCDCDDPGPMFENLIKILESNFPFASNHNQLYPELFKEGDQILFMISEDLTCYQVDYRKKYAEEEAHKKFAERYDLLFEFVDDEKFEEALKELEMLFAQEVDAFVFPEHPILRRRQK